MYQKGFWTMDGPHLYPLQCIWGSAGSWPPKPRHEIRRCVNRSAVDAEVSGISVWRHALPSYWTGANECQKLRVTEISEEMMVRVMFKCVSVLLLCHCTLNVSSINRLVSTAKWRESKRQSDTYRCVSESFGRPILSQNVLFLYMFSWFTCL